MKIYLAAPLFSAAEQEFNKRIAVLLEGIGHTVILPQEQCENVTNPLDIFYICTTGVEKAEMIVAILDGADADSGTCWEVGYGYALKKPILGLRTDFRKSGDTKGFNAMIYHCLSGILDTKDWEIHLVRYFEDRIENKKAS